MLTRSPPIASHSLVCDVMYEMSVTSLSNAILIMALDLE